MENAGRADNANLVVMHISQTIQKKAGNYSSRTERTWAMN